MMAQWDYDRKEAQTLIFILSVEGRRRGIQKQRHALRDTGCDSPVPHEEECVGPLWIMSPYVSAVPNLGALNRWFGHLSDAYDYFRK